MLCETSNDSMLQRVRVVHVVRVSVRVACAGARMFLCVVCVRCGVRAACALRECQSLCRLCFMWERRRTARAFHVHADHAFGFGVVAPMIPLL